MCERRQIKRNKKKSVVEHCLEDRGFGVYFCFLPAFDQLEEKEKAKDQCCNYKHLFTHLVQNSPLGKIHTLDFHVEKRKQCGAIG